MKTLYLLDAYALIYRSYYAFVNNPRITTTGINTSATFGFCNFLLELLELENLLISPWCLIQRDRRSGTRCMNRIRPSVPRCRKI